MLLRDVLAKKLKNDAGTRFFKVVRRGWMPPLLSSWWCPDTGLVIIALATLVAMIFADGVLALSGVSDLN